MKIPLIRRENIGRAYLTGFIFAVLGLALNGSLFGMIGIVLLVWTFISDEDDNHIDPPGTEYVDNRKVRE